MDLNWSYTPEGRVLSDFLEDKSFVSGIMGPYGSGKSTAACMKILKLAAEQKPDKSGVKRTKWGVIRNTYPELQSTTIKTWHDWVPKTMGRWQSSGPPAHRIITKDMDIEVIFLALDSPQDTNKLLSLELTGAWINEARELPKAVLDALTGRVGRYPSKRDGGATWSGIMMDTNPCDDDHWWYRLAEGSDRKMAQEMKELEKELRNLEILSEDQNLYSFHKQPGGRSEEAENISNLPAGYYLKACAGKSQDWIKVYIDGQYGFVREGKPVVPEYNDQLHCKPVEFDPRWPLWIGVDFGLTPATVFGQVNPMTGQVRWLDELVTEDISQLEFGPLLNAKVKRDFSEAKEIHGVGDPAGMERAGSDKTTCFQVLNAAMDGVIFRPASTNDPTLRIGAVAAPMLRLLMGNEPGFLIDPKCVVTRKGLAGGYMYKRVQVVGEERYVDKPHKNKYSHPCEAGQYLNLGMGEGKALIRNKAHTARSPVKVKTYYNPFSIIGG